MSFSLQPSLRRVSQSFVRSFLDRAALRPVPPPRGDITTPRDFLKAIGRSTETKVSIDSWDAFWHTAGYDLRKAGLAVKDRRYILWCMEKYRQEIPIKDYAHEPRPKKKTRGRGPRVQDGKLIRSRRPR
ncbi:hypothetical protein BDN67DRAFT_926886 [Paxillus ammoniavirescens]|nr:hypothetical protein BDN67DRAFT_926886 [Paxillus ammoniavirescens]